MIHKAKGARIYISTTAVDVDAINAAANEAAAIALMSGLNFTEIGEVEEIGEHGDNSEEISFTAIKDGRVRKVKGPRNANTLAITCGRDAIDAGQLAMIAAEQTDYNYAFKIIYADSRAVSYSNTVEYFAGLVMSRPTNIGNVSNVVRRTFNIGINTGIYDNESAQS